MEFSFKDILHIIRKNIVFMLVVSLVIGAGAYFATKLFVRPTYTSTIKLYVNPKTNGNSSYDDINSHNYAQKMVATYIEILNTTSFRNEVAKELPDNYTEAFLKKAITYSEVTDTEVFSATVSCDDPIEAKTVADAVAKAAPATIKKQFEGNASLKIVDEAQLPEKPTSPNPLRNGIIAFVAGMVLTMLIAFLRDYFDVKIKYDYEMTVLCGLPVLAAIPEFGKTNDNADKPANRKRAEG